MTMVHSLHLGRRRGIRSSVSSTAVHQPPTYMMVLNFKPLLSCLLRSPLDSVFFFFSSTPATSMPSLTRYPITVRVPHVLSAAGHWQPYASNITLSSTSASPSRFPPTYLNTQLPLSPPFLSTVCITVFRVLCAYPDIPNHPKLPPSRRLPFCLSLSPSRPRFLPMLVCSKLLILRCLVSSDLHSILSSFSFPRLPQHPCPLSLATPSRSERRTRSGPLATVCLQYHVTINLCKSFAPPSNLSLYPASSVSSTSLSTVYINPICEVARLKCSSQSSVSNPLRDSQKARYVTQLVDQAVQCLCEIWHPDDIPAAFTCGHDALYSRPASSPQAAPPVIQQKLFATRNNQLPSPVMFLPSIITFRHRRFSSASDVASDCNLVPITALYYLEAIHGKISGLICKKRTMRLWSEAGARTWLELRCCHPRSACGFSLPPYGVGALHRALSAVLQSRLDAIAKEHGDSYIDGIQPVFDSLNAGHFDSSWNWVQQDTLLMYYDIIFGRLTTIDREITARCTAIMNRADPDPGSTAPYKDVTFPTAPHTEVTAKGDIIYTEIVRENVRKLEAYVEEMASGDTITAPTNIQKIQDDVLKLWNVVKSQPEISEEQKNRIKALYEGVMRSLRKRPESRPRPGVPSNADLHPSSCVLKYPVSRPLQRANSNLTGVYLDILHEIATSGTTFKDKNALLTGVGKGSIGVEILKGLLSGGAHVVITTSRYSRPTVEYYQGIFQRSKQDVEALVHYYSILGLDLDYILPFAAVPENGREIDGLDDKSELAHRIMLVNLLRLLGAVKIKKVSLHFVTRPTQVILPLSPNHGLFGNDGLYSESKISLETLFNRWNSESWGNTFALRELLLAGLAGLA
ncbi:Fatty acid synthase subunit alpha [Grifola frondosa]|uniref:Fatty acid synthase subunit alpha n=1 Tax=Grifola frondosa TaxID=5627 RepID=A0A1C7MD41_GRIFR|nr:Fatty acid synthase subunit alpha [Grifola frondosa]